MSSFAIIKIDLDYYEPHIENVESAGFFVSYEEAVHRLDEIFKSRSIIINEIRQYARDFVENTGVENLKEHDPFRGGSNSGNVKYISNALLERTQNRPESFKPPPWPANANSHYSIVKM